MINLVVVIIAIVVGRLFRRVDPDPVPASFSKWVSGLYGLSFLAFIINYATLNSRLLEDGLMATIFLLALAISAADVVYGVINKVRRSVIVGLVTFLLVFVLCLNALHVKGFL